MKKLLFGLALLTSLSSFADIAAEKVNAKIYSTKIELGKLKLGQALTNSDGNISAPKADFFIKNCDLNGIVGPTLQEFRGRSTGEFLNSVPSQILAMVGDTNSSRNVRKCVERMMWKK
jgi:hypothetical protein